MNGFDEIWRLRPNYSVFGFKSNPFAINPLFFNYADKALSEPDEKLFVPTESAKQAAVSFGLGKRLLVWGDIGVGKTTIMNMLLYLGKFRENFLPIRVVIREDTVARAVQELLYNYCFELITELRSRALTKPLESAKKWLLERKYVDMLYDFMARLTGPFEERSSRRKRESAKAGVAMGIEAGVASEEALTTSLRTYVESLPIKAVQDRLGELQVLTAALGYKGVTFAVDEADHIEQIDKVLVMLTASREIFFTSPSYTFVVAGSKDLVEQDKRGEASGIFDTSVQVTHLGGEEIKQVLLKRIQSEIPGYPIEKVFDEQALETIIQQSGGTLKITLKLAENALDEAAAQRAPRIRLEHVRAATKRAGAGLLPNLKEHEIRVLRVLAELGRASPADRELQRKTQLSRPRLTVLLNALLEKRLVERAKAKGLRKTIYSVRHHIQPLVR